MRTIVRSLVLVTVALFSFASVNAQNPKWSKQDPLQYHVDPATNVLHITGTVVGMGNAKNGVYQVTAGAYGSGKCTDDGGREVSNFSCASDVTASGTYDILKNGKLVINVSIDLDQYFSTLGCRANFCPGGLVEDLMYDVTGSVVVTINGNVVR